MISVSLHSSDNSSSQGIPYIPQYKPNQLICGSGHTAIITGWTIRQQIAKRLNPDEYAVIGNLYSAVRGITPLLRNLLVNPHVRQIIILNATKEDRNSGSCQCLADFFAHGYVQGKSDTGRDCWVIQSSVTGYIEGEIPAEYLDLVRGAFKVHLTQDIASTVSLAQALAKEPVMPPYGAPMTFPVVETLPALLPGPRYAHRIEGKTIAETWVKLLHRIKTTGTIRPTGYDGQWQELINLVAVVTDEPIDFYFPDPNFLPVDRAFVENYIPQILDDAEYREGVKYTYGQRLRSWFGKDQIEQVINKLIGEIDAASAVMNLWDVHDHDKGGSPCLNHIWVRVVEGEISLTATLRSNDMFSAWVANAMGLRALQRYICDQIQARSSYTLRMGPLMTISQSAHIYDDTWDNVDQLIKTEYAKIIQNRDFVDPSGNFLIEVENGGIVVKQMTAGDGEVVRVYQGKNPLKLIREICLHSPALQPDHVGYLGIELQKAFSCLKENEGYVQDRS